MISVYNLKTKFQGYLQPVCESLYKAGITANQITIAAIILSAGLGVSLFFHQQYSFVLLLVPAGLFLRMALNALDGMLARQFHLESKVGELLNEAGDVLSDLVIILPLACLPGLQDWIIVLFAFLSVFNEFAGILGKVVSQVRRYEGPMGKSDRALFIGFICIGYFYWEQMSQYSNWLIGFACVLLLISTYTRFKLTLTRA